MGREITIYGFTCGLIAVPPGASTSIFMNPAAGEIWSKLKYFSGGSLEIIGATLGNTFSVTAGTGYLLGSTEVFAIDGAARYFLTATGTTAVVYFAKGLSQGY